MLQAYNEASKVIKGLVDGSVSGNLRFYGALSDQHR